MLPHLSSGSVAGGWLDLSTAFWRTRCVARHLPGPADAAVRTRLGASPVLWHLLAEAK